MPGYEQFCPVPMAADVLGWRWTLPRAFHGWPRLNLFASVAPVHDEPGAV